MKPNKAIKILDIDNMPEDSNFLSNLLLHAYNRHEQVGDGLVVTLQLLLELEALIKDEIKEVRNCIIDNELSMLWQSNDVVGHRPSED